MAQGAATSADVPGKYDVVINGFGYMLLQTLEPSLPFRTHRAIYSYSPTFVDRSNVSNSYGDNAQDFFLTIRQRDWSLGEQQKFFRAGQDGRYWMGSNADVSVPGQVRLSPTVTSLAFSGAVRAGSRENSGQSIVAASATNLYSVDAQTSVITDRGAHGLGAAPSRWGVCNDATNVYLTTTAAGTVGVRKWNGSTFTSFSASAADSLAFVDNTLYGYRQVTSDLVRWDTAGNLTSLFPWKSADGTAGGTNITIPVLHAYGGRLLILFPYAQESSEMWLFDGTSPFRLEVLPENFIPSDIEVLYGIAYLGGSFMKVADSTHDYLKPSILFYDGSQIGKLWEANDFNTVTIGVANEIVGPHPALGVSNGRLIFTDETTGNFMAYNPATGGVSSIGSFTPNVGDSCRIMSTGLIQVHTRNQTTGYVLPATTYPSSAYVISSLIDFDSSLPKQFRGVKVEFDAATDGNGGSVDIAYQIDGLTGAWTTLQTSAVSGTEYTLTGISGHAVATRIMINKGTSTAGPTLRSVSVRAAPQLQTFRERAYILDLSGVGFKDPVKDASGAFIPESGHEMALNLNTAITSTAPIQVSDRFCNTQTCLSGSTSSAFFTAICDPANCEIYDTAEGWDNPQHPGGYVAKITIREV